MTEATRHAIPFPEQTLAGGAFLSVSTGNDEIYTYVLAKPDGSSPDTVTFEADINAGQRDGVVETVSIPDVALTHPSPPYTLYRIRLQDDGSLVRTPLIENVRSLDFHYFDSSGVELPYVGGAETPADLDLRRSVRRVSVEIEALTRDPDSRYLDTTDSNPTTQRFRKFKLKGDVTPRNLGMVGLRDFLSDVSPPQQPVAAPQLFTGHCDGLYVSWAPNPPADETAYYRVQYTDPGNVTEWLATGKTSAYVGGLQNGAAYDVAVQAVDAAGNASPPSPSSIATTFNALPDNVPVGPLNPVSTSGLNGRVDLSWDAVSGNSGPTFGDPDSPLLRDMWGYRVYRSDATGFAPGPSTLIADETMIPGLPQPAYTDNQAVNCRPYYYVISAADRCQAESVMTPEVSGAAWTNVLPGAPTSEQATYSGATTVRVSWLPVQQDFQGNPIYISDYRVYRTAVLSNTTDPATLTPADFTLRGTASGIAQYFDNNVTVNTGEAVWYRITATDACPNESAPSAPTTPNCFFSGVPQILSPINSSTVTGVTPVNVAVTGGTGTELYSQLRLRFENLITRVNVTYTLPMSASSVVYSWDASPSFNPPDFFKSGPLEDPRRGGSVHRCGAVGLHIGGHHSCQRPVSDPAHSARLKPEVPCFHGKGIFR